MEEPIIKFETGLLATLKRFKVSTSAYHNVDKDGYKQEDKPIIVAPMNHNHAHYGTVSLPTQALLQKWLRDKHNIHVSANVNFYNKSPKLGYYYSLDCFDENDIHDGKDHDMNQVEIIGDKKGFDSYEECLEAGLFEALKLI